jgi:uncharacterized protein (DUF2225 family)
LPVIFIFICPKCGYRGIYSYASIEESEQCKKKCKRAIEILEHLLEIARIAELYSAMQNIDKQLKRLLGEEQ